MKKYILLSLLIFDLSFGQNPQIKTELPSVIPPSPTVASLMKFEEIPVSNYTGVPNISIPLFSSVSRSKNINIDVALKYHSGVRADDRASDVGLGWNLFAGGTISRTVRGLPDEIYLNSINEVKIGLHNNINNNENNNYYHFIQNIANETQDYYKPLNTLSQQVKDIGNEFLWEAANTGKYDTEHDLWQFNFMGNTGRFYIKKNTSNNQLEVVPLDDYRVKIIYNYDTINGNPYTPKNFIIFDENGMKFEFEVKEISVNKFATQSLICSGVEGVVCTPVYSLQADKTFISAIHLSKIYDENNNLIVDYIFNTQDYSESFTNTSFSRNNIDRYVMGNNNQCSSFPPIESQTNSTTLVKTKKINYIDIKGFSKIFFEYKKGRLDSNINLNQETVFLKSISLKDSDSNFIKKYTFEYDYSHKIHNRMILSEIHEISNSNEFQLKNKFEYKVNYFDTYNYEIGKDAWGFFNLIRKCTQTTNSHRKVTPSFCNTDLLEKIIYPTGYVSILDFESNSYSFDGTSEIPNFDIDGENLDLIDTIDMTLNAQAMTPINITNYKKVIFTSGVVISDISNATEAVGLFKKVNNIWVPAGVGLHCIDNVCCVEFFPEPNTEYAVKYSNLDYLNPIQITGLTIELYNYNGNQFFYGGGNRIKSIKYYEKIAPNYSILQPDKMKNFEYNLFNTQKSSGSLVFPKPLFNYDDFFIYQSYMNHYDSRLCQNNYELMNFNTVTSSNNLISLQTQGSDIGYKNVKVFETGHGKVEFEYLSPIDFPEDEVSSGPPFLPSKNFDYKRGLLKKQLIYNNDNIPKIIKEELCNYDFVNYINHTGTRFRKPVGDCYTGSLYSNYNNYLNDLNSQTPCIPCSDSYSMSSDILCGLPLNINTPKILPFPIFEAYGWAKLTNKTTKNYFYPSGSSIPKIVETNENYTYNPVNKEISESIINNSNGETLTTKYFYHTGNSIHSQNRISEIERIETYRASELLSKSQIIYNNNWVNNVSFLPQTIQTAKGSEGYENRLQYLNYDEFGNPLEVKQEGGIPICYIWGYNKTLPIAKIENTTYASIPASTITNLQNLSNTGTEANLITALNNLRAALPNAMITTYTHKPLIGISTVIDPKGNKQTYYYDSFNRLQYVKDAQGNIVSENEYHYRE